MNISTFQSNLDFIKNLYFHEEWKDEKCKKEILEALEEANKKIEKAFGDSLHRLDKHKPSFEAVEKVVNKFPSTLSYPDQNGRFPIQRAAVTDAFEYVPVLAKQGVRHKVGGEDARGGLLTLDPSYDGRHNTLRWLVCANNSEVDVNTKQLNVLKELRKMGLLVKKDIQEQLLLVYSSWNMAKKKFEYLVNWDPDALVETKIGDRPLIHYNIASDPKEQKIILLLKAGFKYHSHIGGLLFIKDNYGTTGFDCLCGETGVEKAMSLLHDILSLDCEYPILHHVFVKSPEHIPTFLNKFPWATQLRDHHGRSLQQAVLAAGPDIMNANNFLFPMLTDDQIREKDPITTLYPFAAMAVGEDADLEKSFYLLRRHPSVLERRSRSTMANNYWDETKEK
ncbi:hypothetical protein CTEN210_00551 [Chaetoceros tenuissimus]|uniref:Uncharacterized protein n=1 Tax=Chaetoceros tenuissimus TaxID=426638 RepID=A0AAD3CDE5_9STRA|nr:hypothetical protein CTEN210_00551 [Chaetoceros tenuissimus]